MEPPLHGNQGDREPIGKTEAPLRLTVAISREAGARGGSIAQMVGKRLGWQVYTQDLLEFLGGNDAARSTVLSEAPKEATEWAQGQLERVRKEKIVNHGVDLGELPRLIFTLAARGGVVLVGRGAGFLLPRQSTLHIRVAAPIEDRIAYMAQWLRLTRHDAAQQVHERDEKRAEYLVKSFNRRASNMYDYDMVLNSFLLGDEICADLIVAAVHGKERILRPEED